MEKVATPCLAGILSLDATIFTSFPRLLHVITIVIEIVVSSSAHVNGTMLIRGGILASC
jgi:hypothetical protein